MKQILYKVDEACKILNLTPAHTRVKLNTGEIKGVKVGKEWRISQEALDEYMGVKTDMTAIEQQMRIKELEAENKHLKFVISTVKNNLAGIEQVISMD